MKLCARARILRENQSHEHQGQGLHRRRLRAPDAQGGGQVGRAAARRGGEGRARGRGPHDARTSTAISAPGDAPGLGPMSMVDYMGLKLRHIDSTDTGGSSYLIHVAHAAQAIAPGKCNVALVTLAGRPRSEGSSGTQPRSWGANAARRAVRAALRPRHRQQLRHGGRCATCTSTAPPASSSPGSRSRPRTTRSTTRTRCCARSSRSKDVRRLADDRRPAAPPGLLRGERRRRRGDRRAARDREEPEAARSSSSSARARRPKGRRAASSRSHHFGRRVVGRGGVRRGGRQARRHPVRRRSTTASPSRW